MFFIQFLDLIDDILSMDNLFIGIVRRRGYGVIQSGRWIAEYDEVFDWGMLYSVGIEPFVE